MENSTHPACKQPLKKTVQAPLDPGLQLGSTLSFFGQEPTDDGHRPKTEREKGGKNGMKKRNRAAEVDESFQHP